MDFLSDHWCYNYLLGVLMIHFSGLAMYCLLFFNFTMGNPPSPPKISCMHACTKHPISNLFFNKTKKKTPKPSQYDNNLRKENREKLTVWAHLTKTRSSGDLESCALEDFSLHQAWPIFSAQLRYYSTISSSLHLSRGLQHWVIAPLVSHNCTRAAAAAT